MSTEERARSSKATSTIVDQLGSVTETARPVRERQGYSTLLKADGQPVVRTTASGSSSSSIPSAGCSAANKMPTLDAGAQTAHCLTQEPRACVSNGGDVVGKRRMCIFTKASAASASASSSAIMSAGYQVHTKQSAVYTNAEHAHALFAATSGNVRGL